MQASQRYMKKATSAETIRGLGSITRSRRGMRLQSRYNVGNQTAEMLPSENTEKLAAGCRLRMGKHGDPRDSRRGSASSPRHSRGGSADSHKSSY
eukprot:Clim_evm87s210 gene=Clim_evmTU87s210